MTAAGRFVRTRHEWLDILGGLSPVVARLGLKGALADETYKAAGQPAVNRDAFNFAGSDEHSAMIARVLEDLSWRGVADAVLGKLVTDLTSRNIYGAFCELAAYDFLLLGGHTFRIQVPLAGTDILNPNGADLDGRLDLAQHEVFFDAKAFGFTEHLAGRLGERLDADFSPNKVLAGGSFDVPVAFLSDLLGKGYASLQAELAASGKATRGPINFVVRAPARIMVTQRIASATVLASENADYAFGYAKQFVRRAPFLLFFVIHPWVSTLRLHHNFGGAVDEFTSEFAKLTFTRFAFDATATRGVPRYIAASLLTGVVFIDAWQGAPVRSEPWFRCFLNPLAANPLSNGAVQAFAQPYGSKMRVVRF